MQVSEIAHQLYLSGDARRTGSLAIADRIIFGFIPVIFTLPQSSYFLSIQLWSFIEFFVDIIVGVEFRFLPNPETI